MGNYSGAMGNVAPSAPTAPSVPGGSTNGLGSNISNLGGQVSNFGNQLGSNPIGGWFGQIGNRMQNFGQGLNQLPERMSNFRDIISHGGHGWINAFGHHGGRFGHPSQQQQTQVNPVTGAPVSTPATPQTLAPAQTSPVATATVETSDVQNSPVYQAWLNAKNYNNNFNGFNDKYTQLQQMLSQQNPNWTQAQIDQNTLQNLGGYILGNQY